MGRWVCRNQTCLISAKCSWLPKSYLIHLQSTLTFSQRLLCPLVSTPFLESSQHPHCWDRRPDTHDLKRKRFSFGLHFCPCSRDGGPWQRRAARGTAGRQEAERDPPGSGPWWPACSSWISPPTTCLLPAHSPVTFPAHQALRAVLKLTVASPSPVSSQLCGWTPCDFSFCVSGWLGDSG